LPRFTAPGPGRTIGLAWRRTWPRKVDFVALGQIVVEALGARCRSGAENPAAPAEAH
jgi:LysR family transcriptional regulator, hydrogen peroxide-inducible genes activator